MLFLFSMPALTYIYFQEILAREEYMESYRTVIGYGETGLEISKSKFIVQVNRAISAKDAIDFIEIVKKKHRDATHNCSAFIIGPRGEHQKADDDGEPAGTAGIPILETLKKNKITDAVIVVTRYYGGIKLGAGGLIRAYGKVAALGLQAAGILERIPHTHIILKTNYDLFGIVENYLHSNNYIIKKKDFAEQVTLHVLVEKNRETSLCQTITNLTSGRITLSTAGIQYVDKTLCI